jgi:hypothetical protein
VLACCATGSSIRSKAGDKLDTVKVRDGKAKLKLKPGKYTLVFSYVGNGSFKASQAKKKLKVTKG